MGLTLIEHVVNAAKQHAEKNRRKDALPTIYIDASWQPQELARQVGGGAEGPVVGSTRIVGCLKNRGLHVCVLLYPSSRHHSKCASIQRCGTREAARVTAYEAKVEPMDGFTFDARRNENSQWERRALLQNL